jgi:DNA topoisomerase-1
MKHAQQLYENGYITYMRTDSKKYSQEFVENVIKFIETTHGKEYISQTIDKIVIKTINETKELPLQEAHEAIRPVNINIHSQTLENLQPKAIKLYELIWTRTLESCMPSAQYNSISAKITAPLDSLFIYKTEQPIFLGWKIVEKTSKNNEENNTKNYQFIQTLKQNVSLTPKKIDSKFTLVELKSHYTEARLVQLLEEKGIGRPSTFASLVDKIQERKYVVKQDITGKEIEAIDFSLQDKNISKLVSKKEFGNEKNKLVIQPLGIIVIEFLLEKFDMFFNYEYTKKMEDELDKISDGNIIWYELCRSCYDELTNVTNKLQELIKFNLKIDDNHTLIIGKHGPVIKCIDTKDAKKFSFLPVKKNLDIKNLKNNDKISLDDVIDNTIICEQSIGKYRGKDLFIKNGKYGIYAKWGDETKSLKEKFDSLKIEQIQYIDVIRYLDSDTIDPKKPVGFVRELNNHLSIRTGKYGDYIFYKKPRMKTPKFFKLNGFDNDYKKSDKTLILNWIKQKYNVE